MRSCFKKRSVEIWSTNTSPNLNVPLAPFQALVIPGSANDNRCCSFDGQHTIIFMHLMELTGTSQSCSTGRDQQCHRCGEGDTTQQQVLSLRFRVLGASQLPPVAADAWEHPTGWDSHLSEICLNTAPGHVPMAQHLKSCLQRHTCATFYSQPAHAEHSSPHALLSHLSTSPIQRSL